MLYLIDRESGELRWAYEAGFQTGGDLGWVRAIRFPVGVGLFGRAIVENRPQRTDDYRTDDRFVHARCSIVSRASWTARASPRRRSWA